MKIQFLPHGTEPMGYAPPIVDIHGERWLVPPRLVPVDDPQAAAILHPGQYLDLHEIADRHFIAWAKSHQDFKVVNRSQHPAMHNPSAYNTNNR